MERVLLSDTSVVINLLASRRLEEIAASLPWRLAVCRAVLKEALFVLDVASGERELVSLQPAVEAGLFEVWEVESEVERTLIVQYAAVMDDGEAACFALAQHRCCAVATDDVRAARRAAELHPFFEVISTPDILIKWESSSSPPHHEVKTVIAGIEARARYRPGPKHPHFGWWNSRR